MTTLRIYVADLAAYNAGHLHGVWIDEDTLTDADATSEAIATMIAASPVADAEEYQIHDYEGPFDLSKYSISTLVNACEWLAQHGDDRTAVAAMMMADEHYSNIDEPTLTDYRDRFCHEGDLADYCAEIYEDGIPKHLVHYIDWDKMANDMNIEGYSYVRYDGDYHWFSP